MLVAGPEYTLHNTHTHNNAFNSHVVYLATEPCHLLILQQMMKTVLRHGNKLPFGWITPMCCTGINKVGVGWKNAFCNLKFQ